MEKERKDHNVTRQKSQILESHLKQCNSELQKENNELKQRNSELQKYKTDSMLYRLGRIKELDGLELRNLKKALKKGLKTMEEEEHQRLRSEIGECAICLEDFKDSPPVCFIDGCDHVAICSACFNANDFNQCPLCLVPFTKIKILKVNNYGGN